MYSVNGHVFSFVMVGVGTQQELTSKNSDNIDPKGLS